MQVGLVLVIAECVALFVFDASCSRPTNVSALAKLNAAVKTNPENAQVYADRGLFYLDIAEYERALNDFRRAVDLQPGNPQYYVLCARAHLGKENYAASLTALTNARRFNYNLQDIYWVKGQVLAAQGDDNAAIAQFDTSVGIDRSSPIPYLKRSEFHLRQQRLEEARKDADKAIVLDSSLAPAFSLRARILTAVQKGDSAFMDLQQAVELDSTCPRYKAELARAYYDRREKRAAIKLYEQALSQQGRLSRKEIAGIREQLNRLLSQ